MRGEQPPEIPDGPAPEIPDGPPPEITDEPLSELPEDLPELPEDPPPDILEDPPSESPDDIAPLNNEVNDRHPQPTAPPPMAVSSRGEVDARHPEPTAPPPPPMDVSGGDRIDDRHPQPSAPPPMAVSSRGDVDAHPQENPSVSSLAVSGRGDVDEDEDFDDIEDDGTTGGLLNLVAAGDSERRDAEDKVLREIELQAFPDLDTPELYPADYKPPSLAVALAEAGIPIAKSLAKELLMDAKRKKSVADKYGLKLEEAATIIAYCKESQLMDIRKGLNLCDSRKGDNPTKMWQS